MREGSLRSTAPDDVTLNVDEEGVAPGTRDVPPSESRWRKLRSSVQLGAAHPRKPPLKREDSFLKRFSTRPPSAAPLQLGRAAGDRDQRSYTGRLVAAAVLNPDESLLFCWLWLVTCCALHNSWTLIVRQAFPELQEGKATLWLILDWCSDVVYMLDIMVQFRTGYLDQGIMVRDSRRLAKHYFRSKDFFLDVTALTPLGLLLLHQSPMLRFPRFLKARRIYKFYYAVESRTAYPNMWRVANLIHVLLLLAHWFGCFYYMLSEHEDFTGSWASRPPPDDLVRKYLGSVYWSTLTLTTIGDLATPATNLQYLFTIVSYLIGVFIFATIVGQVGNVITNRNASRLEFERLLDGAKLYMRHHKVPKGMQRRVQRWYDYSWSRGRMQGGGDIHSALGILPDKLKTELAIHVNLKTLKKVSIFQECQPEFLHDLVLKMKAYIFTPGDLVCRKGEVAREMFIIADGILQVINDKGQVLTHMRAGDFFGEIGILNLDGFNRRTADVRSVGYSELFSLSREDVLSAMKDYPDAEEILQTMGRRRLMEARLASPGDQTDSLGDSRERTENRQRKIGMSIAQLLRKRETALERSSSSARGKCPEPLVESVLDTLRSQRTNVSPAHIPTAFVQPDARSVVSESSSDGSRVSHLVQQIASRGKKAPKPRRRRGRTCWSRVSRLLQLRRKTTTRESTGETPRTTHDAVLEPENLKLPSLGEPQRNKECRSTSWQLSKPSISNWNRSELITDAMVKAHRRRTLADGILLPSGPKKSSHEKMPGLLMTDLDDTPDASHVSSNFSPPTLAAQVDELARRDELPAHLKEVISSIVLGIKHRVDALTMECEKNTMKEISELKETIKLQNELIKKLESRIALEGPNGGHFPGSSLSNETKPPVDDAGFEEEDLWLTEFPSRTPPPRLRRHSSVEVGRESPFCLQPMQRAEVLKSPRRFSESHARPGVVPFNKTFAAKMRRVLARVKVSGDLECPADGSFEWPVAVDAAPSLLLDDDGPSAPKRSLPTIVESCSFDSLRDAPPLATTQLTAPDSGPPDSCC